jgi:pimeloyl-ACP methyl ester carboxylesterase
MPQISQVETDDGNSWHVEQSGSGPHIIFIPSGEGDCHSFQKIADLLAPTFTVTTFDMPGFSRSVPFPTAFKDLTPYVLANQIISLMDKLSIPTATVFGSSSGGVVAFALLQKHADRVERIIVHEIPMVTLKNLKDWAKLPDSESPRVVGICKDIFANSMNEDKAAWDGLGEEFHQRLETNFITWVRNYAPVVDEMRWDKEELKRIKGKVSWTLGAQMPMGMFFDNVVLATEVGIAIKVLECKHFPYVSIPGELAEYIKGCCQ